MSTKYNFNTVEESPSDNHKESVIVNNTPAQNNEEKPLIHKGAIALGVISLVAILAAIVMFSIFNNPEPASNEASYDDQAAYLKEIAEGELYDVDFHDWEFIREESSVSDDNPINFTSFNHYSKSWNTHNHLTNTDFMSFANQVAGVNIEQAAKTSDDYYVECIDNTSNCEAGYIIYDDDGKRYNVRISRPLEDAALSKFGSENVITVSVTDKLYDNLSKEDQEKILENVNNE